MNKIKEWKKRRKIKKALKSYNEAVKRFADATTGLADAAAKSSMLSKDLFCAVVKINALAEKATISTEEIMKGGSDNGKATGH